MAQASQTKNSFSFVKGLITEASALTFPEDASLDEENFELLRDGSRSRRLGVDYEDDFVLNNTDLDPSNFALLATARSFSWKNVAQEEALSFLVIQIGNFIHFHDTSTLGDATSANKKAFIIDLDDHKVGVSSTLNIPCSFSSGKGFLFINTGATDPIYVKYDVDLDTFTVVTYELNIRDFDGVEDGLEVDERPTGTLTKEHEYNLKNQGWPDSFECSSDENGDGSSLQDPVEYTNTILGEYPSNADIIHLAKMSAAIDTQAVDSYWPEEMNKKVFGNTEAPRGRFIINALNKDRSTVSGISGLTVENTNNRPSASTFFSGRIFLGVGTTIHYSQIIREEKNISKFHQDADPTAEAINELVATDGGVIEIPEAGFIRKLEVTRDKVIVLADQGVWIIDGGSDPFTANNQRAYKISNVGVTSNNSAINVENTVIFTTSSGIYSITAGGVAGEVTVQNLTETTIQTFYLEIPSVSRGNFKPVYDPTGRKIYWFYSSVGLDLVQDRVLVLDTVLQAFYKYKLDTSDGSFPSILDGYISNEVQTINFADDVTDGVFEIVTTGAGDVTVDALALTDSTSSLQLITGVISSPTRLDYTISEFKDRSFFDWVTHDGVGQDYESFLITGYDTQDDILRYLQAPYIQCAFNRTEDAFTSNPEGGVAFRNPSGCFLETRWDWSDNFVSGKISTPRQVYRFRRPAIAGVVGEPFDNGLPVVTTRNKVRGRGKALHLKFTSESGKDCQLLGWATNFTGTTEP